MRHTVPEQEGGRTYDSSSPSLILAGRITSVGPSPPSLDLGPARAVPSPPAVTADLPSVPAPLGPCARGPA